MLGRESPQRSLFGAYLAVEHLLTPGSFYAVLYRDADRLIRDDDFADCYDTTTGRPSVPPARMAKLLLLQTYEDLSDRAALERMAFDLRWKAILGLDVGDGAVGQATLVEFRARLQLHGKLRAVFDRFLALALEAGLIQADTAQAIDSTAIWGRGAVEDTYNLIGAAVRTLLGATARRRGATPSTLAGELALVLTDPADARSLKGRAAIDWDVPEQRRAFLNRVVAEARQLLAATADDQGADPQVAEAATLLRRILVQDLEPAAPVPGPPGSPTDEDRPSERSAAAEAPAVRDVLDASTVVQLRRGVAPGRVVSVGDPAMRVGHKSERVSWTGYKAHVSVETGTEFITGIAVSDATAYDGDLALPLLRQQAAIGLQPMALVGDRAYSKAAAREAVAAHGSELVARVPPAAARDGCFSKEAFTVDLVAETVTCPAGVVTREQRPHTRGHLYVFPGAMCAECALRPRCTPRAPETMRRRRQGRTIILHPLESVLQQARTAEPTPRIQALLRLRVAAERRLAHVMRTGLRQARYVGRAKVESQALATALVVNLRRLAALFAIAPPGSPQRARWAAAGT